MNNIPFLEEGAEYDNAKQKFANWNNICCGCCHKHNAVLPENSIKKKNKQNCVLKNLYTLINYRLQKLYTRKINIALNFT